MTEGTSPTSPQQEVHLDQSDSVTEKASAAEEKEEVEEEKNTHIRHVGVPVMGLDLLAEMKARQEKMVVKKVRHSSEHAVDLLNQQEVRG